MIAFLPIAHICIWKIYLKKNQHISNKTDIRVTIIGDKLSAVRILSDGSPVAGDWRITPKESLQYDDFNLPEPITSACLTLARKLRLEFAAIDLLETEGEYYFLEVNPTGEWGWLNCTERRFDTLIADWLANPPKQPRAALGGVANA